jgi:hypothetical protein
MPISPSPPRRMRRPTRQEKYLLQLDSGHREDLRSAVTLVNVRLHSPAFQFDVK